MEGSCCLEASKVLRQGALSENRATVSHLDSACSVRVAS